MKFLLTLFVIVTLSIFVCNCAPVDSKDVNKDSKCKCTAKIMVYYINKKYIEIWNEKEKVTEANS